MVGDVWTVPCVRVVVLAKMNPNYCCVMNVMFPITSTVLILPLIKSLMVLGDVNGKKYIHTLQKLIWIYFTGVLCVADVANMHNQDWTFSDLRDFAKHAILNENASNVNTFMTLVTSLLSVKDVFGKVYINNRYKLLFIFRWVHAKCEDLHTEEEAENAAENAFRCSQCRPQLNSYSMIIDKGQV